MAIVLTWSMTTDASVTKASKENIVTSVSIVSEEGITIHAFVIYREFQRCENFHFPVENTCNIFFFFFFVSFFFSKHTFWVLLRTAYVLDQNQKKMYFPVQRSLAI